MPAVVDCSVVGGDHRQTVTERGRMCETLWFLLLHDMTNTAAYKGTKIIILFRELMMKKLLRFHFFADMSVDTRCAACFRTFSILLHAPPKVLKSSQPFV